MADVAGDLQTLKDRAKLVQQSFSEPPPPLCGGKSPAHCQVRIALIRLGWLDGKLYPQANITKYSEPAMARLQAAIGAEPDGKWGSKTAGKLMKLLDSLGRPAQVAVLTPSGGGGSGKTATAAKVEPEWTPVDVIPKAEEEKKPFSLAAIPWWVPAAAAAIAAAGYWFFSRKRNGALAGGCSCEHDHGDHDHHDHGGEGEEGHLGDGLPPEMAQAIEDVKSIPSFRTPGQPAATRRPKKQKKAAPKAAA